MVKKKQFKHLTFRKQINYFLNFSARIMIYYLPVGQRGPFWYKPGPRHKFTPLGFAPVQFLAACSFCPSCTPLKQLSPPSYLPSDFTSSFTESVKKGGCWGGRMCCQGWLGPGGSCTAEHWQEQCGPAALQSQCSTSMVPHRHQRKKNKFIPLLAIRSNSLVKKQYKNNKNSEVCLFLAFLKKKKTTKWCFSVELLFLKPGHQADVGKIE